MYHATGAFTLDLDEGNVRPLRLEAGRATILGCLGERL